MSCWGTYLLFAYLLLVVAVLVVSVDPVIRLEEWIERRRRK